MRILHPILGKISHKELSELPTKLFTLQVVHHSLGPLAHVCISLRRTNHIQGHPSRSSEKLLVHGFEVQNHVNSPHIEWNSTQVTPFMSLACITLASPLAPTMSSSRLTQGSRSLSPLVALGSAFPAAFDLSTFSPAAFLMVIIGSAQRSSRFSHDALSWSFVAVLLLALSVRSSLRSRKSLRNSRHRRRLESFFWHRAGTWQYLQNLLGQNFGSHE